ncbi:AzlD domain-containing protein [Thauera linaloolentis]|uniref:Integrase n=1 Tax=Thauera linaloolentis (strain DSM 12138 / JCM 21573 / CCUG 41526 / CIP 105981 / IAM 15112 / NBRC 102519 / 47Lol) TaxID=1123367 RepID=N6YWL5_THAL4|nr:AzlD domain-containing protein [Thauera linaloolentis]ENO86518.1 integrase [Thauera linaloolentis 47Lol = DSM 12138]MCM8566495.1 AzlD domain-containing protein [Thauera linaloolentis]
MSTPSLLALLVAVGILTFLYRYAMIGLFARHSLPGWLHALCRHIAPASFAALTASALFVTGGEVQFAFDTPRPWAALAAVLVAWRTRSVLATIVAGMAALYLLKYLVF